MNPKRLVDLLACALLAFPLLAQVPPPAESGESKAFASIESLLPKGKEGGENPTEKDLETRHEAGLQMAKKAIDFLRDYPDSKKSEDASALAVIGYYLASLSGDVKAAQEMQIRVEKMILDPKVPEMLKVHAFILNQTAHWAQKNGKRTLNQNSREGERVLCDAMFDAVDALPNKEAIFKMLLLQAKSARELSAGEKLEIAERVLKHPLAPLYLREEAQKILSGVPSYEIGQPIELKFTAIDGRKVDLQALKGKVVLIEFWATWCGPCVAALPALKETYEKYHDKGLDVLGISLDDDKQALLSFIKKRGIAWPQFYDGEHWNNEISRRFGINAVPTLWLIDRGGILRTTNPREDTKGLALLVEQYLNAAPDVR